MALAGVCALLCVILDHHCINKQLKIFSKSIYSAATEKLLIAIPISLMLISLLYTRYYMTHLLIFYPEGSCVCYKIARRLCCCAALHTAHLRTV